MRVFVTGLSAFVAASQSKHLMSGIDQFSDSCATHKRLAWCRRLDLSHPQTFANRVCRFCIVRDVGYYG
jgi:hypothetical protein